MFLLKTANLCTFQNFISLSSSELNDVSAIYYPFELHFQNLIPLVKCDTHKSVGNLILTTESFIAENSPCQSVLVGFEFVAPGGPTDSSSCPSWIEIFCSSEP